MEASLEGGRTRAEDDDCVILIAGPTASGKSALALELAAKLDGVIINADSMQLYEDLRLVSARPSADEMAGVPHRLYGVVPASTASSTGAWLRLAAQEIDTARAAGRVPILVGGTGLYFKGLTEGFAEMPAVPEDVRRRARDLAEREGAEGLRSALLDMGDGEAAEGLEDPQRLTRALEVIMATGKPLSLWQREGQSAPLLPGTVSRRLVLAPPRPWLHERIARRARLMLSREGCEEVRLLLAKGLSKKLPAMRAIGVAEIGAYLAGECSQEEAIHRLTVATRQYAKRQETWFRNQMGDWQRLDPSAEISAEDFLLPRR
ncbi:tRNA (adenosine(37)-N6)-dimethylallyltransferase MiaA [Labrenzia sp. 011]|uniref:tRNA (adenosine(37)-N6)-dimethylallyltransferase MiaA n=1 Tax=Labrenzia sp. 011 TaxID=2171494 RepID=UPI000D514078|nr:tRNA (adenosine(37)-N6)-dimethylallyltransferase MiaA [Labrenzia sp. 011]PVB61657.1 tRNA (adenosine(37)-N6)-dimethylallyltransferase MiaA [Labrenzia sp. 011]